MKIVYYKSSFLRFKNELFKSTVEDMVQCCGNKSSVYVLLYVPELQERAGCKPPILRKDT